MKAQPLTIFLPDTRGVEISRYGRGNRKIGMGVFTYSRPAGRESGTCPGSTEECEAICYAKRIVGPVFLGYLRNRGADVPEIPQEAKLLRLHVSGDFDSSEYIENWIDQLTRRPDVTCWAYTRSWRVPELLESLERLRALPNMQLFASMDASCEELPPTGWRRAWIDRSWDSAMAHPERKLEHRLMYGLYGRGRYLQSIHSGPTRQGNSYDNTTVISDGTPSYVCPEETGRKPDCESCRYCFHGQRNDVTFLEH
jgi:hypothetical protein